MRELDFVDLANLARRVARAQSISGYPRNSQVGEGKISGVVPSTTAKNLQDPLDSELSGIGWQLRLTLGTKATKLLSEPVRKYMAGTCHNENSDCRSRERSSRRNVA